MSDFSKAASKVQTLKKELEDRAEASLEAGMEDVSDEISRHVDDATGVTAKSITHRPAPTTGDTISKWQIVGPDWWKYLEFGTGIYTSRGYSAPDPGAPFPPIYQWVMAKGIQPDPHEPAETQRQVAHAIANSLSIGQRSNLFVRPAWRGPRGKRYLINLVQLTMKRAVNRAF